VKDSYINHVLEEFIADGNFQTVFGDGWIDEDEFIKLSPRICDYAFRAYGIDAGNKYADHARSIVEKMLESGGIAQHGDEYAGYWYKLRNPAKQKYIEGRRAENPANKVIATLGEEALRRALAKIVEEDGLRASDDERPTDEISPADLLAGGLSGVPASDRIVTLGHNQISETDASISEIVDALEEDNGNPHNPGLRERILGQIKAGRELIRAGEFRAYLLYEVLVRALGELVEKYGNPTIAALANALLGAIVSQFFQAS
jgi:hypothetical protein